MFEALVLVSYLTTAQGGEFPSEEYRPFLESQSAPEECPEDSPPWIRKGKKRSVECELQDRKEKMLDYDIE